MASLKELAAFSRSSAASSYLLVDENMLMKELDCVGYASGGGRVGYGAEGRVRAGIDRAGREFVRALARHHGGGGPGRGAAGRDLTASFFRALAMSSLAFPA